MTALGESLYSDQRTLVARRPMDIGLLESESIRAIGGQVNTRIFASYQVGNNAPRLWPGTQPDMMMAESEYDVFSVW